MVVILYNNDQETSICYAVHFCKSISSVVDKNTFENWIIHISPNFWYLFSPILKEYIHREIIFI